MKNCTISLKFYLKQRRIDFDENYEIHICKNKNWRQECLQVLLFGQIVDRR